jgi:uncharacterized protein (TIGR02145 family)
MFAGDGPIECLYDTRPTATSFNQPIGNWDVSNVSNMSSMFSFSHFNQPIDLWCVSDIKSEPNDFSSWTTYNYSQVERLASQNKPVWGKCPNSTNLENGTVTDIDGKVYNTVQLGTQLWMESNLRVSRFNDGTNIPQITLDNPTAWSTNDTGAWSYYDDNVNNNALFGKLYNFYVVDNQKNICPTGWEVPSDGAWTQLSTFIGSDAGKKMKSTSGWRDSGNGTNSSGFNAFPAGRKGSSGTAYTEIGQAARFWSSTENNQNNGWVYRLTYDSDELQRAYNQKGNGFSIRCMLDPASPVSIDEAKLEIPVGIELKQNYPNPFNPTTQIRFALPESGYVTLEVYTLLGQKVMTLVNEYRAAGWHTVNFNGAEHSSGVYVYRIQAGGVVQTRKFMLMK